MRDLQVSEQHNHSHALLQLWHQLQVRLLQHLTSRVHLSYTYIYLGAVLTLEEVEEAAAGTMEGTTTTSRAPVLLITGGGGGAPGSTEAPVTTRAAISTTGGVSGTASVQGSSSAAICMRDTSAPGLSSGGEERIHFPCNHTLLF